MRKRESSSMSGREQWLSALTSSFLRFPLARKSEYSDRDELRSFTARAIVVRTNGSSARASAQEQRSNFVTPTRGATVDDLIRALNALGATPRLRSPFERQFEQIIERQMPKAP